MSKKSFFITGIIALLVGVGIGNAGHSTPPAAAPSPAVTITSEPVVKTETVTKVSVPQECLTALDDADALVGVSSAFITLVQGHMGDDARLFSQFAGGDMVNVQWYLDGQKTFTATVTDLSSKTSSNGYNDSRSACRAAAK